MYLTDHNI